ncbi:hypothetical protein BKA63DRAFT_592911 [Paraphoma chrysanthemicola]|nr:hypothetical protein BKA63DRAFT_592911 [Paraphoma chrysanthemicola]
MNYDFDETNVWVPCTIYLERPASLLFTELVSQDNAVTPPSPNSGVRTTSVTTVSTRDAVRKLSRTLNAHFGHVPNTFDDLLVGGVSHNNGIKIVSAEGQQFRNDGIPDLISQSMTDKYGPSSFFRAFVTGKVSTMDCQTLVTNYSILAHKYTWAVAGKSPQVVVSRLATAQRFTSAVTAIHNLWIQTYESAKNAAAAETATTSGHQNTKLGRRVALYVRLEANPPQSEINVNTITNVDQANGVLKTPLWDLPQVERPTTTQE